ncbi:DUF7286 family protein [Halobellus limi]|uniref:Uncharacterized protein n=1 Tax=Halobellus limi TaxID=699433 RepID=A0A1H5YZI7_9EURY|nr:hypothetical protein [Halobellus limi]QCC48957.1 hypothetical protein DV707_11750 [Halobellus limi]SEG29312.1 hypothetical protein SAMN04488133_1783 [Halobellus limi]
MRLAEDDRGRVPFALVGVLLLVASSTFAVSLATPGVAPVDRSADVAADRVDAEATAALRVAARDAARAAARDPVTVAADTEAGRALDGPDTFRRYLRLRIFLAAREAMVPVEHRRGASVARASFGESVESASEAIDRVSIAGVDDGTELRVTLYDLELTVERDGRPLDARRVDRTVTVGVPALALHDRTDAFQKRLDAGPIEAPGLARRTTVGVTAMAQARGLGQYGGLPISNVVANRHVALSTNAGLLDAQRAAFGRSDPDAAAGVRAATLRTGVTDVLDPYADGHVVSAVTGELPDPNAAERSDETPESGALPATKTVSVGVNGTADEAFLELLRGASGAASLDSIRRDGYRASVSVRASTRAIRNERRPSPRAPGENWTLVFSDVSKDVSVSGGGSTRSVSRTGTEERRLYSATRRVTERWRVERTWVKVNETPRTTTASWRDVHRVRITGTGRLPGSAAPTRPVRPLFESGGALGGPNLQEAGEVSRTLVSDLGGPDTVARRAVTGGRTSASRTITGDRPADLEPWVYADVADLRGRVRDLSIEVEASDAATGHANGAARLAALVRDRRAELVDAPNRYDGVADRTRVAARAAYLDQVLAGLDARAGRTRAQNAGIDRALDARGLAASRVNDLAKLTPDAPSPRTDFGGSEGARGETTLIPDGDPAYLAPDPVEGTLVDGVADGERYVGLAVRNVNVFSVPYGDAADLVTRTLFGDPGRVSLHTAGQALVAADRTLETHPDETLEARRDVLETKVEGSMGDVRAAATRTLARETSLDRNQRRRIVDRSFARFDGPGERAVAATDGSLAREVAAVAVEARSDGRDGSSPVARDRIRVALRVDLRRVATSERVRVPESAVDDAVSSTREFVEREATDAAERATEEGISRATNGTVGAIPAGLPISPTLSPWVATANLWIVESRGAYGRFAVGVEGGETTYVRDGSEADLDVDGDGVAESLGRSRRVQFSVRTVAIAVVPPGKFGVGDTDGNTDERSVAWSDPSPGPRCVTPTGACPRE